MLVAVLLKFLLVLTNVAGISGKMYSLAGGGMRRRGNMARTIYNRMQADEQHKIDSHSYWYYFDKSVLPEEMCAKFLQQYQDGETQLFLDNCYEKSDWVFTQLYHSIAKTLMSLFMENTSINGWLGRGSMFIFSRLQFQNLMNMDDDLHGDNLLDLGAGDGEVTQKMSPFFTNIYATETSGPMVKRLKHKGYRILDVDKWDNGSITFDLIACLNLLDRCDKPVSILHSMKKVLKPGGHIVVAIVLPFSPYVEFGGVDNKPTQMLNVQGETFEEQSVSLVKDVFQPAGFSLVQFSRLPYLCEGDLESSFYVLDDAVFVLKLTENDATGLPENETGPIENESGDS